MFKITSFPIKKVMIEEAKASGLMDQSRKPILSSLMTFFMRWSIKPCFFLFLLTVVVCSCSKRETVTTRWSQENGKVKVLTTIAMIEDLVKQIGGEDVDVITLIRGELDPHSYELVKGDDEKFERADLIFYNGLGLEHGLSLRQNLINNHKAVAVTHKILKEKPSLFLKIDGQYDPHIWMDIGLWVETIDSIVDALSEKDPEHGPNYRARAELVRQEMLDADTAVYELLQAIDPQKRYLVTSHDAFHYFARHYLAEKGEADWQIRCRAPEGLAPEAHMSVSDVVELVKHIRALQISVLFPESNVSKDSLRKIVHALREMGSKIRLCQETLYGDSMGGASSYLEMIIHNAHVIARELSNEE